MRLGACLQVCASNVSYMGRHVETRPSQSALTGVVEMQGRRRRHCGDVTELG